MINRRKKVKNLPEVLVYEHKVDQDCEYIGEYNHGMPLPRVGEFIYDSILKKEFYLENIRHLPNEKLIILYVRDNHSKSE